jgi:hypothetical protein
MVYRFGDEHIKVVHLLAHHSNYQDLYHNKFVKSWSLLEYLLPSVHRVMGSNAYGTPVSLQLNSLPPQNIQLVFEGLRIPTIVGSSNDFSLLIDNVIDWYHIKSRLECDVANITW